MNAKNESGFDMDGLRRRAEEIDGERLPQTPEIVEALSPEAAWRLVHELRVHQIELEMQNEALRHAQAALEESHARYFDLFDMAPVGYLTVSEQGLILEANLAFSTWVGVPRSVLLRQLFSRYIFQEDQERYFLHRKALFQTNMTQVCEVRLQAKDAKRRWIQLDMNVAIDAARSEPSEKLVRCTLSDITERKTAELEIYSLNASLADNLSLHEQLNAALEKEIRERQVVEKALANTLRQEARSRQRHSKHIIDAQEEERKRIARELHDEILQSFAAIIIGIKTVDKMLNTAEPGAVNVLADLQESANLAIVELHQIIYDLRPSLLDDRGLVAALQWHANAKLGAKGIGLEVAVSGKAVRLSPSLEVAIFRIIQEAITNIVKYSGANKSWIFLHYNESSLSVVIKDDGKGFDVGETLDRSDGKGLGLRGMKERAELFDGTFDVQSSADVGTVITIEIPLKGGEQDGN